MEPERLTACLKSSFRWNTTMTTFGSDPIGVDGGGEARLTVREAARRYVALAERGVHEAHAAYDVLRAALASDMGDWKDASAAPAGKMLVTYRIGEDDVTRAALRIWPDGDREWIAPDGRTTVTHHSYAAPTHWLCEAPELPTRLYPGRDGGR